MYPTKKLQEILDKTNFSIWKIKTKEYLEKWDFPIVDQWKNLIWWYSNDKKLVYNWKLPVIVYWDHTNIVKYINFPFIWWADWIKVLPFKKDYDERYCYYLIETYKPETQWYRRHFSFFKEIDLPLPPLPTQKLIIQKLDESFEKIDKSIGITKKNLESLEQLNKSVLEVVFRVGEYEIKTIEDSLEFLTDYHANGSYENLRDNVKLIDDKDYALMIRATDLENNNFINWVKYITEKAYNFLSKSKVFWNEIIIPKIWTIWNVYLMPELNIPVSLWMNIFLLKVNSNNFSKYIYYYLISEIWRNEILSRAQWAVTKTITKIAVKTMPIPLPPLPKQKEIVTYLDKIFEKNKTIKEKYEKKLKDLEELKQSLLKDAFEWRLIKE